MKAKTIKVDTLARVEGEGALYIRLANGSPADVKLRIYEPPRFFEALLRKRAWAEVPDITARICGICSLTYQITAAQAIESAFGVAVSPGIRELRRLIACGEWIQSHALHIFLLHAPDFLGYPDALAMAKDHPEAVKKALAIKKAGNAIVSTIGGREIHAISLCAGGIFRAPARKDLQQLLEPLRQARDYALDTLPLVREFPFPDFQQDYEFVALRHADEYAMNDGRLVSNKGLDIAVSEYLDHFVEKHVAHSTALHSVLRTRGSYCVGPLARFNLNFDRLPENVRNLAAQVGITPPALNPFHSIVVRLLETVYACEEAIRLIESYSPPDPPRASVEPLPAVGHGCTEAPRGILYHRYEFDAEGRVLAARIVPPTSQNQKRLEDDLRALLPALQESGNEVITARCEQAIRNYDPCLSCATHFLRTTIVRE